MAETSDILSSAAKEMQPTKIHMDSRVSRRTN